jgi:hypothetical protein
MWFLWWLRWQGFRLIFGDTTPQGKGWGQPARVRLPVEWYPLPGYRRRNR